MSDKLADKVSKCTQNLYLRMGYFVAGAFAIDHFTSQHFGNPYYHLSGFAAGLVGRYVDHYCTIPFVKLANTPEFKENSLDQEYCEKSPYLGRHPTMHQYIKRSIFPDFFLLSASVWFPPFGYTFLSFSPLIYFNNTKVRKSIERDLESCLKDSDSPASVPPKSQEALKH